MKTGLSKFHSRVTISTDVEREQLSMNCEVPGCDSLFTPGSNGFPDRHECGKAFIYVNDYGDRKRGICGAHYIRGLVKAGKHPNQDCMNSDGSMSPTLVRERWERLDAEAAEKSS